MCFMLALDDLKTVGIKNIDFINRVFSEIRNHHQIFLYLLISIAAILIFTVAIFFRFKISSIFFKSLFRIKGCLRELNYKWGLLENKKTNKLVKTISSEELNQIISTAGYGYDPKEDLFYSILNPWQRSMGYCHFFDEVAPVTAMVLDCEPIKFIYKGKLWLVEFWKGQYGMNTGCEIGLYKKVKAIINIPGIFMGSFYKAVDDSELMDMSMVLKKNGEEILRRHEKHWWLTGFKLGMFSDPSELVMELSITFKDEEMLSSFVGALLEVGYASDEIDVNDYTVSLVFDEPKGKQPSIRNSNVSLIAQASNRELCENYQEITEPYDNFLDKVNAIQREAPDLFEEVIDILRYKELKKLYQQMKIFKN